MQLNNRSFKEQILARFKSDGNMAKISLQNHGTFIATVVSKGVEVSNLNSYPLLEWKVFDEIEALFNEKGSPLLKGNVMAYRLGESGLPLDSIEGRLAYKVYGKKIGDSVFRRISPIAGILVWAKLCNTSKRGYLSLNEIVC